MMSAPTASQPPTTDVGSYKILVEGKELNQEYQVVSIDVQCQYNKIASAKILLLDGDPAGQIFKISDTETAFTPGKKIEIRLGYHQKDFSVFKGIIIRHALRSKKQKQSFLSIEAREHAVRLTIGRKNRSFYNKTDTEIMEEVTDSYGLTAEIDKTGYKHPNMIAHAVSDWDFIVSRAELNGLMVLTRAGSLVIKKPVIAETATRSFTFGLDEIYEAEAEIDARSQFSAIISQCWNPSTQRLENSDSGQSTFKDAGQFSSEELAKAIGLKQLILTHAGNLADQELQSWSDTLQMRSKLSKIRGRIKVQGLADLNPGDTIDIQGLSNKFNGKMLVCGIYQQFSVANWETDIQFGIPAELIGREQDLPEIPAAGIVPGIQGLQIGIVVKLENDPAGEDRVQVKIPFIENDEGIWARIASLDAGAGRGAFFRPEINDEVLLGFINNDPRHPVILGMLNSSAKPAPLKAADANHEKGFITRSGFRFIFNDDQKSCELLSPGGKSVLINDQADEIILKDEHSNKISMNASGISIESAKDLKLKATGGEISCNALNISSSATAKFAASGNGALKVSSSGITEISGTTVKIN